MTHIKKIKLIYSLGFLLLSVTATQAFNNNLPVLTDAETLTETLSIYNKIDRKSPITGNIEQLGYFFQSLAQTKTKKVRVAHFGDSLIMGDVITGDLRIILQTKYGGRGIGFLSPCNDDVMLRYTLTHRFSDDWDWASVFTRNPKRYPLSITGIMSVPAAQSTVSYEANRMYEQSKDFKEVRIFYDKTNSSSAVKIITEIDDKMIPLIDGESVFNEAVFKSNQNISSANLSFQNCENALIYGISLENGPGIYVDNFAMRGNSGASLSKLDEKFLLESQENLNYKLIIFNYGINIAEAGRTDYTWYKKKMIRIIEKFKKMYPQTSMLLISAGDKGVKKGSKVASDSIVPIVVKTQEEIAEETDIAFWNLYEAIGGKGAIVDWVDKGFVSKDYIHFNQKGGERVAELLTQALLDASNKIGIK